MRRTKIVATIGPASREAATVAALLEAGMDVARLNFSHGTQEDHAATFRTLREEADRAGKHLAILADLQGPKIRVGKLAGGALELVPGGEVTVTVRDVVGADGVIPTTYRALPDDVRPGDRLLLDDGAMELTCLEAVGEDVRCRVVTGGRLLDHKGINLPGVKVSAPSLTEKDREDLAFALDLGVDYIALSFVRTADDVRALQGAMRYLGRSAPIVVKIEKPEAIGELDAILAECDAVMVARGDLGVETPLEEVPLLQKRIIARAHEYAIPVITATQMLQSMVASPRPTRAEASDVANAVFDDTDAVMLSGETATGAYPVEAVRMMARIAEVAETETLRLTPFEDRRIGSSGRITAAIAHTACEAAHDVDARGIVVFTHSGATARLVSINRPATPVVALTPTPEAARRTALYWGVQALRSGEYDSTGDMALWADRAAKALPECGDGDVVVVTSGSSILDDSVTNSLRLHVVRNR